MKVILSTTSLTSFWLQLLKSYLVTDLQLICTLCTDNKWSSAFTAGKSFENPKKDDFTKHEITGEHKLVPVA